MADGSYEWGCVVKMFYTDPLKAAWMSKNFDVCYSVGSATALYDLIAGSNVFMILEGVYKDDGWTYGKGDHFRYYGQVFPLYIHPDSLHIFEPKVRDVLEDTYIGIRRVIKSTERKELQENYGYIELGKCIRRGGAKRRLDSGWCKIIRRDNKAFFAPEVEA